MFRGPMDLCICGCVAYNRMKWVWMNVWERELTSEWVTEGVKSVTYWDYTNQEIHKMQVLLHLLLHPSLSVSLSLFLSFFSFLSIFYLSFSLYLSSYLYLSIHFSPYPRLDLAARSGHWFQRVRKRRSVPSLPSRSARPSTISLSPPETNAHYKQPDGPIAISYDAYIYLNKNFYNDFNRNMQMASTISYILYFFLHFTIKDIIKYYMIIKTTKISNLCK